MAASSIHLKVVVNLDGTDTTHDINTSFADMIKYDMLRNRKGLPKQEEGTFLFMGVVAYCALVRLAVVPNTLDVMAFLEKNLVDIEIPEDEAALEDAEFPAK